MGRSMTPDIIFFNWAVINFSQILGTATPCMLWSNRPNTFPANCIVSFHSLMHGSSWSTFLISCQKVLPAVRGLGAVFLMFIQTSLNCRRSSHRSHAGARPPVESVLASPPPHPQLRRGHQLSRGHQLRRGHQLSTGHQLKAQPPSWAEATSWKPSPPVEQRPPVGSPAPQLSRGHQLSQQRLPVESPAPQLRRGHHAVETVLASPATPATHTTPSTTQVPASPVQVDNYMTLGLFKSMQASKCGWPSP